MRWLRTPLWLALAALALPPAGARADAEPTGPGTDRLRLTLDHLASPLEGERERGARIAASLLQGDHRARLLGALRDASPPIQRELINVLATDGQMDAIRALIVHLGRTSEEQARRIMLAMARSSAVVKHLGEALAKDKDVLKTLATSDNRKLAASAMARLQDLEHFVRRAEIEALLVSRKSPSGGTGYYKGQYDVLKEYGHRDLALAVCAGIALDEALAMPGMHASGVYDFLHTHDVEILELRGMAINAVAELAQRDDEELIARFERKYTTFLRSVLRKRRALTDEYESRPRVRRTTRFQDELFALGAEVAEMADYLICLHAINEDAYRSSLDALIFDLERGWDRWVTPQHVEGMIPGLLIRAGRYEQAADEYWKDLHRGRGTTSYNYYNLACAYASWSREPGDESAADLREQALFCLRKSFDYGWRDFGWMQEDRDLDPVRDTNEYRAIVREIKRDLGLK